ncbi:shikimate kinase [Corynebacterium choanae]|uniref:Shikimate kinase n=1 Tax=Corynebacterium choanae TaxID=1862358 RepID=A0A3G6J773_9CORY|nr:shikimate kinase [Corynebacterium choanae]AZA13672.1 Shikimate kinase [Corynebacterium choanae]
MSYQSLIYLVGPPGAGKTTIGRRLASALSTTFIDTDERLAHSFGMPCGEIIRTRGLAEFRQAEAEVIRNTLAETGIVSLGGGAVETPAVRDMLREHTVVWLDVSPAEGVRRTSGDTNRPLLAADDPLARYIALRESRTPLYSDLCDMRVRTDQCSPQQAVAKILNWCEDHPDTHPPTTNPEALEHGETVF